MQIQAYAKNAKKHSSEQLESLAKIVALVGWRQPVIVNQRGVIVAGHGRWFAYQMFKDQYNLKPIWVMDDAGNTVMGAPESEPLSSVNEKIYRLADNKVSSTEYDMPIVIEELAEIKLNEGTISLTGFDEKLLLPPVNEPDDSGDTIQQKKKAVECPECGHSFIPQ